MCKRVNIPFFYTIYTKKKNIYTCVNCVNIRFLHKLCKHFYRDDDKSRFLLRVRNQIKSKIKWGSMWGEGVCEEGISILVGGCEEGISILCVQERTRKTTQMNFDASQSKCTQSEGERWHVRGSRDENGL